ncbi:hypothetical protein GCM10010517_12060 [Streptosporangium fragile]|uniref:Uncharacterized protein n=1 Tax=Streptosporangium fragile TaxID=46186 RepID=A0ABP6IA40_9ACTN
MPRRSGCENAFDIAGTPAADSRRTDRDGMSGQPNRGLPLSRTGMRAAAEFPSSRPPERERGARPVLRTAPVVNRTGIGVEALAGNIASTRTHDHAAPQAMSGTAQRGGSVSEDPGSPPVDDHP